MKNKTKQATAYVVCARRYASGNYYTSHIICVAGTLQTAKDRLRQRFEEDKSRLRQPLLKSALRACELQARLDGAVYGIRYGTALDDEYFDYYIAKTEYAEQKREGGAL